MVTSPGRRCGSSNFGCLLSLLVFVAALYYGFHIGEVFWRYYQFTDAMRLQARLAPSLTDETIRRRLIDVADSLDLPPEATRIKLQRSIRNGTITITSHYREHVSLPLFDHTFSLSPRVVEPL